MSFASSVTFDLSLKDLIQGLGDTSLVLVEGWDGGASGRVKFQLPSFGFRHVWGTTYIPSSLWKQAVASPSITWIILEPDWFLPYSCPASPETWLVSLENFFFFFFFGSIVSSLRRRQLYATPVLLSGKSKNGGPWKAAVHGVTEGQKWLSNFTFIFHFHALEKEMATLFSVLFLI